MSYETRLLSTPYARPDAYGALAMPVYNNAAYEFPDAQAMEDAFCGRTADHSYSRCSNPTVAFFEQRVQAVTEAAGVIAFNSGMAAISNTLLALTRPGVNVISSRHLFGNTLSLLTDTLGSFGVEARLTDLTDPAAVEACIDDDTTALFLEVLTNPQLEVADLAALTAVAHRHGIPVVADSTAVPFCTFHARDWDIDVEVVSSTKYISGGATSIGGLLIDYGRFDWTSLRVPRLHRYAEKHGAQQAFFQRVKDEFLHNFGALMSPQVAHLQLLGLESLSLRFERQASSALTLARALREEPRIRRVNYTGLPDHPSYALSLRQFGPLPGAMLTIDLADAPAVRRFLDRLQLIRRATNLFDHRSLAIHPYSTIFGLFTPEEKAAMHLRDTTVRLSIGLEDPADLLADIRQALA